MDDPIGVGRAGAQAVEVLDIAPYHLDPGPGQAGGRRIRAGQADDVVTAVEQFADNRGADKTGRAGDEYSHRNPPGGVAVLAVDGLGPVMSVAVISITSMTATVIT
jgi:hypothetical protein